jgi:membrane protease YdiL (CAAX protease family)
LLHGFGLRRFSSGHAIAAVMLGLSAWVPTQELHVLQSSIFPLPAHMLESLGQFEQSVLLLGPVFALVVLALIPAICEESLFRGVLFGSLAAASRPWVAILASAVAFGVFHFLLFKFLSTVLLGVVLAVLCWRSRSILPGVIMHLVHNAVSVSSLFWPWREAIGVPKSDTLAHLPVAIIGAGVLLFAIGILLSLKGRSQLIAFPSQTAETIKRQSDLISSSSTSDQNEPVNTLAR